MSGKPTVRNWRHSIQPITARKVIAQPIRMLGHGTYRNYFPLIQKRLLLNNLRLKLLNSTQQVFLLYTRCNSDTVTGSKDQDLHTYKWHIQCITKVSSADFNDCAKIPLGHDTVITRSRTRGHDAVTTRSWHGHDPRSRSRHGHDMVTTWLEYILDSVIMRSRWGHDTVTTQ